MYSIDCWSGEWGRSGIQLAGRVLKQRAFAMHACAGQQSVKHWLAQHMHGSSKHEMHWHLLPQGHVSAIAMSNSRSGTLAAHQACSGCQAALSLSLTLSPSQQNILTSIGRKNISGQHSGSDGTSVTCVGCSIEAPVFEQRFV